MIEGMTRMVEGKMGTELSSLFGEGDPSYSIQQVVLVIGFSQFRSMYVVCWFPYIVTFGVFQPFDEVLQLLSPSVILVTDYLLHFVLFFSFYCFWWRSAEVGSVLFHFPIWGEKRCMECVVDVPSGR
jgi:hypothetical protein